MIFKTQRNDLIHQCLQAAANCRVLGHMDSALLWVGRARLWRLDGDAETAANIKYLQQNPAVAIQFGLSYMLPKPVTMEVKCCPHCGR